MRAKYKPVKRFWDFEREIQALKSGQVDTLQGKEEAGRGPRILITVYAENGSFVEEKAAKINSEGAINDPHRTVQGLRR